MRPASAASRQIAAPALIVLILLTVAAYSDSFRVPFFFDDRPAILRNPTIRHLWPGRDLLNPPVSGVSGRPVANFSLAVNYVLGGTSVWGYHFANLAIHILTGLVLFGIARRTLRRPILAGKLKSDAGGADPAGIADMAALAVAGIWLLHPLLTETVTCIVQRTESIVSLFYLLTIYCFIRGAENSETGGRSPAAGSNPASASRPPTSALWFPASVLCCLMGMASKEVMATAPLLVLLYDRTFLSGSFRVAARRHMRTYLFLAATWLPLAGLVLHAGGSRGRAAGFGLGITPWSYALTQCQAVVHYVRLALWPFPLVVDYGGATVADLAAVLPQAIFLGAAVALTMYALWRRPVAGFLGAWFFVILAPSSSVIPLVSQTMAEHRMYLPLAAVTTGTVIGIQILAGRRSRWIFCALLPALTLLTWARNQDYRSEVSIWSKTVALRPGNLRARNELANALEDAGKNAEAIAQYEAAMQLAPDDPGTRYNLALALARAGRTGDAIQQYKEALRLNPLLVEAHNALGNALIAAGRTAEGISQYKEAIRLKPGFAEAHYNLGVAFFQAGRLRESEACFETAVRLKPDYAEAYNNLGSALFLLGRKEEAVAQYEAALRLAPDYTEARDNLMKVRASLQAPP